MRRVDFSKLGGVLRSIYLPNDEPHQVSYKNVVTMMPASGFVTQGDV